MASAGCLKMRAPPIEGMTRSLWRKKQTAARRRLRCAHSDVDESARSLEQLLDEPGDIPDRQVLEPINA